MALKEAAFRIFSLKVQFPLCNSATHWTVRGGTRKRVPGSQPCRSTTDNTYHNHGHCMFIIISIIYDIIQLLLMDTRIKEEKKGREGRWTERLVILNI